jgi:hypothetical protein
MDERVQHKSLEWIMEDRTSEAEGNQEYRRRTETGNPAAMQRKATAQCSWETPAIVHINSAPRDLYNYYGINPTIELKSLPAGYR